MTRPRIGIPPKRRRPGRIIGIGIGTVLILVIGLYGPATLAGPLPQAHITVTAGASAARASTTKASAPALPTTGASAIAVGGEHPAVVASAGIDDPVPMAGVAKLVTALVVLDAKPLAAGRHGPYLTMTQSDADLYAEHASTGDVSILVQPGEQWSELQMLQAMLLGSSNNHADSLADWAYGGIDDYVDAATTWLRAHGLTHTQVADASGLSEHDVTTAADAARLAALAFADPAIAQLIAHPVDHLVDGRPLDNETVFQPALGVTGLSRSFTDAAGVCFVFSATTTVHGSAFTYYGALLRQPDYPTLSTALKTLTRKAQSSLHRFTLIRKGASYATVETAWGQQADATADGEVSTVGWRLGAPHYDVAIDPLVTADAGRTVGRMTVTAGAVHDSVPVVLSDSLEAPSVFWRLGHPFSMIAAFVRSFA